MRWVNARVFIIHNYKALVSRHKLKLEQAQTIDIHLMGPGFHCTYSHTRPNTLVHHIGIRTSSSTTCCCSSRINAHRPSTGEDFLTWVYAWSVAKSSRLAYSHFCISWRHSCASLSLSHYLLDLAVLQVLLDSLSARTLVTFSQAAHRDPDSSTSTTSRQSSSKGKCPVCPCSTAVDVRDRQHK
jgi:hypothetical protein